MNAFETGAPRLGDGRVGDVASLTQFANDALPSLRRASGLMCFDRPRDVPLLRGESVRYSIMVLLGLLRRSRTGGDVAIDPNELHRQIHAHREGLGVGDLGLLLWADVRMGAPTARSTLAALDRRSANTGLGRLEGMEIAWLVLGAVEAQVGGLPATAVLDRAVTNLYHRGSRTTPLLHHDERGHWRSRLPNFATEIYSLLALSELARHDLASGAQKRAVRLADVLIDLRQPDGGWPWLFHADSGVVVERYEIYSVHQDAMAPMAFFALAEVTGDEAYARAAVEGFQWCLGKNELAFDFYETGERFAHRSIRRRGAVARRGNLLANSVLAVSGRRPSVDLGGLEINTTCRPYHLGWILEAWSGRDSMSALKGATA